MYILRISCNALTLPSMDPTREKGFSRCEAKRACVITFPPLYIRSQQILLYIYIYTHTNRPEFNPVEQVIHCIVSAIEKWIWTNNKSPDSISAVTSCLNWALVSGFSSTSHQQVQVNLKSEYLSKWCNELKIIWCTLSKEIDVSHPNACRMRSLCMLKCGLR